MKKLFLLLSLFFVLHLDGSISKRDMHNIKNLFEELVTYHDFAYTIFGSKPMSLADMCLKVPPNLPIHKHLKACYIYTKLKRSLSAWYKCSHEFQFKDFIFLDQEEDLFDCLVLVLINKPIMLKVLHEHISLFQKELGDSFSPESFLEQLERKEISLAKATHGSDQLLGIMLGYGERNATLFQERSSLLRQINGKESSVDCALDEQLKLFEALLGDFNELEENPVLPPLYFLADTSHQETIALKQKYAQEKKDIEALMRQTRFMDKVFHRLIR